MCGRWLQHTEADPDRDHGFPARLWRSSAWSFLLRDRRQVHLLPCAALRLLDLGPASLPPQHNRLPLVRVAVADLVLDGDAVLGGVYRLDGPEVDLGPGEPVPGPPRAVPRVARRPRPRPRDGAPRRASPGNLRRRRTH